MKRKNLLNVALMLMAFLLVWGCDPSDPGSPVSNQAPETRIVVAPLEDAHHDHYVSPSIMFRVRWFGHDVDGEVAGYYLQVDDDPEVWIVRGDSAIAFTASEPDPDNPGMAIPAEHTVKASAVDNEGLRDPTPATRTFTATNYVPEISGFIADFPDSAAVGPGIYFAIEWEDMNPSGMESRVSVDGQPVSEWDTRMEFQFCDLQDPTIIETLEEGIVYPVDVLHLSPGPHTLSVQIRDKGGAVSEPLMRQVTAGDNFVPALESISSVYGASAYYPDGSIFYRSNTVTSFTMNGSASDYFGEIHSYRYRCRYQEIPDNPADSAWGEWAEWSDWGEASFDMENLDIGEYHFQAQCRDWANFESGVMDYILSVVEPKFDSQTLLIIDETRDGNGRVGSPNDLQCDTFYRNVLGVDTTTWETPGGWQVSELDYRSHRINDASYVSARDVFNKRIIIWHTDDKSEFNLADNTRILSEFLDRGGRLIISGWDVLNPFGEGEEITFSSGFAYQYLRLAASTRNNSRAFIGMTGFPDLGYPDLSLDRDKVPSSWDGLDKCWLITPRHRTDPVGGWNGFDENPDFEGENCAVRNFTVVNPWRTIILGFPLYFMQNDQAAEFLAKAIEELDG